MKIAIIGGGISGLSVYSFLKSRLPSPPASLSPHSITILEAYGTPRAHSGSDTVVDESDGPAQSSKEAKPPVVGAGFGISPNGMEMLRCQSIRVYERVCASGFPCSRMQMKTAEGWTLGAFESEWPWRGAPTADGSCEGERMVCITWQALWNALRDEVDDGDVVTARTVDVRELEGDAEGVDVVFADGRIERFDLVIGADGVRSMARYALLGGESDAYYLGMYSVGGFMSDTLLPHPADRTISLPSPQGQMVMAFSRDGFFGYTPIRDSTGSEDRSSCAMWWSTWSRDQLATREAEIDVQQIRADLLERHRDWVDPTVHKAIQSSSTSMARVATWITPKISTWHGFGGRVVLAGDAAHTLTSSSGQGVSQALSDAFAISRLLEYHLGRVYANIDESDVPSNVHVQESEAMETAWRQYEKARKAHVEAIRDDALKRNDMKRRKGLLEMYIMYFILWIMLSVLPIDVNKSLTTYRVWEEVDRVIKEDEKKQKME